MDRDEMVEVEVEVKHESTLAYLVHDGDSQVWIPKSQVGEVVVNNQTKLATMSIKRWVAEDTGLV